MGHAHPSSQVAVSAQLKLGATARCRSGKRCVGAVIPCKLVAGVTQASVVAQAVEHACVAYWPEPAHDVLPVPPAQARHLGCRTGHCSLRCRNGSHQDKRRRRMSCTCEAIDACMLRALSLCLLVVTRVLPTTAPGWWTLPCDAARLCLRINQPAVALRIARHAVVLSGGCTASYLLRAQAAEACCLLHLRMACRHGTAITAIGESEVPSTTTGATSSLQSYTQAYLRHRAEALECYNHVSAQGSAGADTAAAASGAARVATMAASVLPSLDRLRAAAKDRRKQELWARMLEKMRLKHLSSLPVVESKWVTCGSLNSVCVWVGGGRCVTLLCVCVSRVRWSESIMWRLHKQFYDEMALRAWNTDAETPGAERWLWPSTLVCFIASPRCAADMEGSARLAQSTSSSSEKTHVPFFITSNGFTAASYAQLAWHWLKDVASLPSDQIDATQPVYLLECGAGLGRFAVLFVRSILHWLGKFPIMWRGTKERLRCVYVMSDLSKETVRAWTESPELRALSQTGVLAFARFDADTDTELRLQWCSGSGATPPPATASRSLSPTHPATNPVVVMGNYFFDSLLTDRFRVMRGKLQEGFVTTYELPAGVSVQHNTTTRHAAVTAAAAVRETGNSGEEVTRTGLPSSDAPAADVQQRLHREWTFAPVDARSRYPESELNGECWSTLRTPVSCAPPPTNSLRVQCCTQIYLSTTNKSWRMERRSHSPLEASGVLPTSAGFRKAVVSW